VVIEENYHNTYRKKIFNQDNLLLDELDDSISEDNDNE